ncbi:MAG: ACT domain-containing protein [Oscillospiraceae bacterium]|nr:ACT domain-containing protein [Oscillospiraceae bacterium]
MKIQRLKNNFAVCKVKSVSDIDFSDEFCFVGKTDEEISLVCTEEHIPENTVECEKGWSAFRICGTLDFSLVGILSKISAVLAENNIGIFAVSTYNTDYILTKSRDFDAAADALMCAGYEITE